MDLYISKPSCKNPQVGVVYLTDVFGIQLPQNTLYVTRPLFRVDNTY